MLSRAAVASFGDDHAHNGLGEVVLGVYRDGELSAHPVSSPLERHHCIEGYVPTYTGKAVGRSSAGGRGWRDRHQRLRDQ